MEQANDGSNPSPEQICQTFKQHYAGTFVAKRQMQQHDTVDHENDTHYASDKPNPLEIVMRWWAYIHDQGHSNAVIAVFTIVIAVASVSYGVVALFQWCAMQESNETNREALVSVQRAFVFLGSATPVRIVGRDHKVESYVFKFEWNNSGVTPTKKMTGHVSFDLRRDKLPVDFAFPDIWHEGQTQVYEPLFIAPHGFLSADSDQIPINGVQAMLAKQAHIYFWGWVRYRDIFDKTPEHVSKFCVEWTGFAGTGDPFDLNQTISPVPVLSACTDNKRSTCYDEQCTADD